MNPFIIPVLGLGALKAGFGLFQGSQQAAEERAATRETVRRMRAQNAQILGQATAVGAGDEFGLSGSLPAYLQLMSQEMNRQVEWTRKAGNRRASLAQQAGIFGAATDFGGSLVQAGQMSNWWQKKPDADGL